MEATATRILRLDGRLDGLENMALDSSALDAATRGISTARIYEWDGPWVSLGRYQKPESALDFAACERYGVRWVSRPTGGWAVLHGTDITLSVAAPRSEAGDSLHQIYRELATSIVEALRACGVMAGFGAGSPVAAGNPIPADCFLTTSPHDIVEVLTGAKVAGTALRVTRHAALMQASIPAGQYPVPPEEIYLDRIAPDRKKVPFPEPNVFRGALAQHLLKCGFQ